MSDQRRVGGVSSGKKPVYIKWSERVDTQVRELAARERRSISGQIQILVERALEAMRADA